MASKEEVEVDYTLNNPDTLTKYKTAGTISQKVLETVTAWCVEGVKIIEICQKGDALLNEEVGKVFKGKKINKGIGHATTISPSSYVTPYTPLVSDAEEAATVLGPGEVVKIQLGVQIDGFCTIVCDTIVVPTPKNDGDIVPSRQADLLLATYWANELFLRLLVPPGLLASGTDEEKAKAAASKPPSQTKISQLVEKVVKSYDCNLVESTTSWLFEHNDIEGKKKIILSPAEGQKGDGSAEAGEVWGIEIGVSLGSGKCKKLDKRATLHRRTGLTYQLKSAGARKTLSEIVNEFKTFPFSLRQLPDERAAKVGVLEGVRHGVLRQYEVEGEKDDKPVARVLSTIAITKNGITLLSAPPKPDLTQYKTDNKIKDEEILKILDQPISRSTGSKSKNKKKKKSKKPKKPTETQEEDDDEESSDDE